MSETPAPVPAPAPVPSADPASTPAPATKTTQPKQENALLNLLLNVLLPVTILSYLSKESRLGPTWALIVAVALPVGYQIYDWSKRKKWNAFSIIGTVSVLLTGGLGLLKLNAQAFALKEAAIPFILAFVFLWTHWIKKPLARALLMNPDLMDTPRIERAVDEQKQRPAFERLMWQVTWMLTGSMLLSAVMNYFLCLYFLTGKEPGSEDYNQGIAAQTGWGFLVIGLPMVVFLVFAFIRMTKGLQRLTGLKQDELLLPR